jgi:hypothetical protein
MSTSQIVHQEEFVPQESPLPDLIQNDPKIAFGRVVMPYFFRIKEEDYLDITPRMIAAADPEKFKPYLLPASGGEYAVEGVALTSAEYEAMVRYPRAFGKAVNNTEYHRRRLDDNTERRHAQATSQEIQTLEHRALKMQGMLQGIATEKSRIKLLAKEAKSPGYAHQPARVMREAALYTYHVSFKRILEVVGREKGWSEEQADLASRSLDARLLLTKAARVGNWRSWLGLAGIYSTEREKLLSGRNDQIEKLLGTLSVQPSEQTVS